MSYRYWTKEDEDYLKENYSKVHCSLIAKKLNRSEKAVQKKAVKMGLKSKIAGSLMYSRPHNKGKTGRLREQHHAWRKVGEVWTVKGNVYTKEDRDSRPILYRRFLLKKEGLNIRGKVVIHIDGNTENVERSNLKLVTRAELVERNRHTKYPLEVRQVIEALNKLKKAIRDYEK